MPRRRFTLCRNFITPPSPDARARVARTCRPRQKLSRQFPPRSPRPTKTHRPPSVYASTMTASAAFPAGAALCLHDTHRHSQRRRRRPRGLHGIHRHLQPRTPRVSRWYSPKVMAKVETPMLVFAASPIVAISPSHRRRERFARRRPPRARASRPSRPPPPPPLFRFDPIASPAFAGGNPCGDAPQATMLALAPSRPHPECRSKRAFESAEVMARPG